MTLPRPLRKFLPLCLPFSIELYGERVPEGSASYSADVLEQIKICHHWFSLAWSQPFFKKKEGLSFSSVLFLKFIYLFIYFGLCWVFVSVRGLSLVAESGGHSSSRCAGLSLSRPLLLRSTGSRRAGSVVVAHGPSCTAACGIFPDQGSNPCPLH